MVKLTEKLSNIFDKQRRAAREIVDAIEVPRLEIMTLREERSKIETASIADTEIRERVTKELRFAEERARSFFFADALATPHGAGLTTDSKVREAFKEESLGMLVILGFRDDIADSLIQLATKKADASGRPYTEAERAVELTRIDAAIRDAERHEEQLCRLAEGAGISVTRRVDANMEIVLAEDL